MTEYQGNYVSDRNYTDHNHELAELQIYAKYGIEIQRPVTEEEKKRAKEADIFEAIDYIGYIEKTGLPFAIQERTRDSYASKYNDVTVRFERPQSTHNDRKKSEFYKLDSYLENNPNVPFLMMYAVRGEEKDSTVDDNCATFEKYAFVDLRKLYAHIKSGRIVVGDWVGTFTSYVRDGIMYAPVIENSDPSSNFVTFDVGQLIEHFPDVVLEQSGFDAPKIPLVPGYRPEHMYSKIQGSITTNQSICIQQLLEQHSYPASVEGIRNLTMREASNIISYPSHQIRKAIQYYPQIINLPKQREKNVGMDI